MKRLFILLLLLLGSTTIASAREAWHDWCQIGNQHVITSGLSSTTVVQKSAPSCVVTIYVHGGGLATIYADNNGTVLANPFTSQSDGQIIWYADNGVYDQTTSSAGLPQTVTLSGILLCDPFTVGSTCNNGGSTTAHNLLSTTHLDTIPASPPVRGDVITAQNQTSPTGVNPSWARLAIGTNGQVLTSNGVDALWATPAGGSGCTLPNHDTAVLSEHPAGTCYDSLHWTWDDGTNKQNMLVGDGSNTISGTSQDVFILGISNSDTGNTLPGAGESFYFGQGNSADSSSQLFVVGESNTISSSTDTARIIGDDNTVTSTGQLLAFGWDNIIQPVTGVSQGMNQVVVIGQDNTLKSAGGTNSINHVEVVGVSNSLINNRTTGGGSTSMKDIFVAGESNGLTASANTNTMQNIHIVGSGNTLGNTLASTLEVEILGEQNTVDGSLSTAQIVGFLNVLHNVSSQSTSTVNTTVIGSANAVTNTGNTGANAYQGIFGGINTLQNCVSCWIVGENITNSTNSLLAIGMSTVPEMAITSGHNAITGHIDQSATKNIAGTCSMAAGTTCTWTLTASFSSSPICIVTVQSATLTGGVAGCTVSGTTVTITANSSNSLTWGALLIGNPN